MDTRPIPTLHPWPTRIFRSVWLGLARLGVRHVRAHAAPFDLVFEGPSHDCITRHIYRLGSHEPEISRYVLDHVHVAADEVAIDVGANIGWYSVLLDRLSEPGARIFAFEPDPATYRLLLQNLATNQATRVTPVNIALAAAPGTSRLRRYRDRNNGRHTLMEGPDGSGGTVDVPVGRLDTFWQEHGLGGRRVRLLKIDVEGYEYFVLRGAGELLNRCDCLLLEYAPWAFHAAGLDIRSMMDELQACGLQSARVFAGDRLEPVSFESLVVAQDTQDLLLTRGD